MSWAGPATSLRATRSRWPTSAWARRGSPSLPACSPAPEIQIVAVCDPNRSTNDYVEWGKDCIRNTIRRILGKPDWQANETGCPGGRDVGQEVVDTYYANQRGVDKFKGRQRLRRLPRAAGEREGHRRGQDHDARPSPRHRRHRGDEEGQARHDAQAAGQPHARGQARHRNRPQDEGAPPTSCPTAPATGNRRIAARIKEGAIGTLREIHNWSNRPVWPQYTRSRRTSRRCPKGFDWDLWLGPSLDRPYHPHYTHAVFRGWYEFGGGSMADMGIYSLWPVFTEFDLGAPLSADAWATHTCTIEEQVSKRVKNDFAYPAACTIHFKFAARAPCPALDLFWYDGGMKPRLPDELEAANVEWPIEGILFVGDQGRIFAGFNGQNPQLAAKGRIEPLFPGEAARSLPAAPPAVRATATPSGCPPSKAEIPRRAASSTPAASPMPSPWEPSPCAPAKRFSSTART